MTNAYLVANERWDESVTVFARNSNEALSLFQLWRERHSPKLDTEGIYSIQLTEAELPLRPQLEEARRSGLIGIGWWIDHRAGWVVGDPEEAALGHISAPVTDVNCYVFQGEDYGVLYVFERAVEQAIATYNLYSLDANGWEGEYDAMHQISRWVLVGPKTTLREDMDQGLTGIGHECEDGAWHIFPPDYEPPIVPRNWRR